MLPRIAPGNQQVRKPAPVIFCKWSVPEGMIMRAETIIIVKLEISDIHHPLWNGKRRLVKCQKDRLYACNYLPYDGILVFIQLLDHYRGIPEKVQATLDHIICKS